jgi:predicted ribosomally synthesized peptide with SipW-like signal peptide
MSSNPKKNRTKQYLMLLTVAGLIAIVGGSSSGTFASFTAETTNAGNYFATGTLFLHQSDNQGATTCNSEDGTLNANNAASNGCDVLFKLKPLVESSGIQYAELTLKNAGTIDSAHIKWESPNGCVSSTVVHSTLDGAVSATDDASTITIDPLVGGDIVAGDTITVTDGVNTDTFTTQSGLSEGGTTISIAGGSPTWTDSFVDGVQVEVGSTFGTAANLCTGMQMVITETDATFAGDDINGAAAVGCAYGTADTHGCQYDGSTPLSTLPDSMQNLTLATDEGLDNTVTHTGLDAGGTRYFLIAVKPPTSFDNTYQNRSATFDLRWHLEA